MCREWVYGPDDFILALQEDQIAADPSLRRINGIDITPIAYKGRRIGKKGGITVPQPVAEAHKTTPAKPK